MKQRPIAACEVIYREGDPGDALNVIQEGEVEVLRTVGGEQVRLAVLRRGTFFGEMGVIRSKPRSTTTRAHGAVVLVVIPKKDFLGAFREDNPLALSLLRMLCERLLEADTQLVEKHLYSEGARLDENARIGLRAASPEVETQIGSEGVTVEDLPFRVGRHALPGEGTTATAAELALPTTGGAQISPLHFAIEAAERRLPPRRRGCATRDPDGVWPAQASSFSASAAWAAARRAIGTR